MLVQLDHIALTVENGRKADLLSELGYKEAFSCHSIPNPLNKRELMAEWTGDHSLTLYERAESIPVELIDYGHYVNEPSHFELPYGGIFDSEKRCGIDTEVDSTIDTIKVRTSSVDSSREFWTALGLSSTGRDTVQFEPTTGQSTVTFQFRTTDQCPKQTQLDASGFPCVAFVTTSLERDQERMSDAGYKVTEVSKIELPHRTMEVIFVIGPDGVPVELITPA